MTAALRRLFPHHETKKDASAGVLPASAATHGRGACGKALVVHADSAFSCAFRKVTSCVGDIFGLMFPAVVGLAISLPTAVRCTPIVGGDASACIGLALFVLTAAGVGTVWERVVGKSTLLGDNFNLRGRISF